VNLAVFTAMVLVWGVELPPHQGLPRGHGSGAGGGHPQRAGAATLLGVLVVTGRRLPRNGRVRGHMVVVSLPQCSIPFTLTSWVGQYLLSSVSSIYIAVAPT